MPTEPDAQDREPPESLEPTIGPSTREWVPDLLLTVLILAAGPFALGALGSSPVWLVVYTLAAGLLFTTIAWMRERRHRLPSAEDVVSAAILRTVVVGLIGGAFFILGHFLG